MYNKNQEQDNYKITTIRIKQKHYDILKDKAIEDHRSTNYLINKILIDYINIDLIKFDFDFAYVIRATTLAAALTVI